MRVVERGMMRGRGGVERKEMNLVLVGRSLSTAQHSTAQHSTAQHIRMMVSRLSFTPLTMN
jgi:hypothetical protein